MKALPVQELGHGSSFHWHDALLSPDSSDRGRGSLAGLVTSGSIRLTVPFSFCDFFLGLDLLKGRKLSYVLGHWFARVILCLRRPPTNSAGESA